MASVRVVVSIFEAQRRWLESWHCDVSSSSEGEAEHGTADLLRVLQFDIKHREAKWSYIPLIHITPYWSILVHIDPYYSILIHPMDLWKCQPLPIRSAWKVAKKPSHGERLRMGMTGKGLMMDGMAGSWRLKPWVFPRSSQVDLHLQVHPPRLDAQDLLTSNDQQKILKRLDELFMFWGGILATMMQHALISQWLHAIHRKKERWESGCISLVGVLSIVSISSEAFKSILSKTGQHNSHCPFRWSNKFLPASAEAGKFWVRPQKTFCSSQIAVFSWSYSHESMNLWHWIMLLDNIEYRIQVKCLSMTIFWSLKAIISPWVLFAWSFRSMQPMQLFPFIPFMGDVHKFVQNMFTCVDMLIYCQVKPTIFCLPTSKCR